MIPSAGNHSQVLRAVEGLRGSGALGGKRTPDHTLDRRRTPVDEMHGFAAGKSVALRDEQHVALLGLHACLVAEARVVYRDNRRVLHAVSLHRGEGQFLVVVCRLDQLPEDKNRAHQVRDRRLRSPLLEV